MNASVDDVRRTIYRDVTSKHAVGVNIPFDMCFYSPDEVLRAVRSDPRVTGWLAFVRDVYLPPERALYLFYPCTTTKPYSASRSRIALEASLSSLGPASGGVHVLTVSEPYSVVPVELEGNLVWYDCPGLFGWWCRKFGMGYSRASLDACVAVLSDAMSGLLRRTSAAFPRARFSAFVRSCSSSGATRPDHTHRRIVESASSKSGVSVTVLPDVSTVKGIVASHGASAWNYQGVAHPAAQSALLGHLRSVLC